MIHLTIVFTNPLPHFKLEEKDTHRYDALSMNLMSPGLRLRLKFRTHEETLAETRSVVAILY